MAGDLNVAVIGAGVLGRVLMQDALKVKGVRFKAVSDIWESYDLRYAKGRLRKHNPELATYVDYRDLLEKEQSLDAVIVASRVLNRGKHAKACLDAGLHVYCCAEISLNLDEGREVVAAARKAGKLLQIGRHRRSNPIYQFARELIAEEKICGRITTCYAQWNGPVRGKPTCPERTFIPGDVLKRYGYESMDQFLQFGMYWGCGRGPTANWGGHQVDAINWLLGMLPRSVMAVGGRDYYKDRAVYSDIMAIYEYGGNGRTPSACAHVQGVNTNGFGSYFERFMGDKGTLALSEWPRKCYYVPEPGTELSAWMAEVEPVHCNGGLHAIPLLPALRNRNERSAEGVRRFDTTNVHQFHLENFFDAVRANDKSLLTCSGETGYTTETCIFKMHDAIGAGEKLTFAPEDFVA